jgi:hypothetical protein
MRSIEDLIDYQEGSNGDSYFQGGNEMISTEDLIDCQESRGEILYFQVGKGIRIRLSESLRSSEVSSDQQGVLIDEYSCGFADHVNEDDEKLNTSTIREEYQRCILIIGGIKTFLPRSQVEASINVAGAAKKGQPTETFKEEEEKEKTLMFSLSEGEEHST